MAIAVVTMLNTVLATPSSMSAFASIDEQRHRQKISRAAGTEPAGDEDLVNDPGAILPAGSANTPALEKTARRGARKAQTGGTSAMQKIGVLHFCNEGEARLDARSFRVVPDLSAPLFSAGRPSS